MKAVGFPGGFFYVEKGRATKDLARMLWAILRAPGLNCTPFSTKFPFQCENLLESGMLFQQSVDRYLTILYYY